MVVVKQRKQMEELRKDRKAGAGVEKMEKRKSTIRF